MTLKKDVLFYLKIPPSQKLETGKLKIPFTIVQCARKILNKVGQKSVSPAHLNTHGNNAMNKMKLWKMFKGSTSKVIRRIISKFQKDFEICGYEETLSSLRKIASDL